MVDRKKLREHHYEVTYVLGRFLTEHLIRVYAAFDGDLTAAIVLGVIGQHNYRRYYTESGRKLEGHFHELVARGDHLPHARPCNALSISDSTGIPRETVRRKIRMLIRKGWVKQVDRDKLIVTEVPAQHFVEFNMDTFEWFHSAAEEVLELAKRRGR